MLYTRKVRQQTSLLPKLIVVRMVDNLLPEEIIAVKFLCYILKWSKAQLGFITVLGLEIHKSLNLIIIPAFAGGLGMLISEHSKCRSIALQIYSLMMEIVEEEIGYR